MKKPSKRGLNLANRILRSELGVAYAWIEAFDDKGKSWAFTWSDLQSAVRAAHPAK